MAYSELRKELSNFYLNGNAERAKAFSDKCFAILEEKYDESISILDLKLMQYEVITENFEPKIFRNLPFFYETGVLSSLSDGARWSKDGKFMQANGFTASKKGHILEDSDPTLMKKRWKHGEEKLYLICGKYTDEMQHVNFNNLPFLESGLKGVYERAEAELKCCQSKDEEDFLKAVCRSMLLLKQMAEKFAEKAEEMLKNESNPQYRKSLTMIANSAKKVPWNAPESFYEALATVAFFRTAVGSLEGAGPNTFGRLDMELYPFYKKDIDSGKITKEEAYDLTKKFLIMWDCHYDHDMKMEGYSDHELENTYTIGGCDKAGNTVFNDLTTMLLSATREENIIFPKIKCRFSVNSPKAYLDEINKAIIAGTSTVLFANDDAIIPALTKAGRQLDEARDYYVSGCWGIVTRQEKYDHGSYINLLKPFEFAIHARHDKIKEVDIPFVTINGNESFEEIYKKVLKNCRLLIEERTAVVKKGAKNYHLSDRFPIISSSLEGCIENHADYTMNGGKYRDDFLMFIGLPNITDSLLAIKKLVFEQKKHTLKEFLDIVRANWEGHEELRIEATKCPGYGDGNDESIAFASKFNDDLFKICSSIEGSYGGKVNMGHLTYTEIRFWGEQTLATPDGRYNGDYFSQGLTPSRLKNIPYVTSVINTLSHFKRECCASGDVVNIILPSGTSLDAAEAFLRATASSALHMLQLNCTSKEELLDAQKNPEKYPHLIVRVCGFSAKFTSLTPQWQEEVLSRTFYK